MSRKISIPLDALPSEGSRSQLRIEGHRVTVFNVHGALYAIDATCPHAGASLANGKVEGRTVQCPAHGLRFDLLTGRMPAGRGLTVRTYAIEERDGEAYLTLPETVTELQC